MNDAQKLNIIELVDVETLQRVQDAFSDLIGVATWTTDVNGEVVTKGSNFTDFCMKYTRQSELGKMRCEWCDKFGAVQTLENCHETTYYCHAGLIDFAAPIIVNGQQVGCFLGGQVLTKAPNLSRIRSVAKQLGIDPDEYVAAAERIPIKDKAIIDRAAEFLYRISHILADMAYGKLLTIQASEEIEKAAKMKSDFLANMSHEIRTPMNAVIGMAEMALREDLPPVARDYIHQIRASGRELLTIINDILDFSKIESGKMDIVPVEYEAMSIVNDVVNIIMTRLKGKDVELILDLQPDTPKLLLGDNIRIKQVLINIANNAAKFTNEGKITIKFYCEKTGDKDVLVNVSVSDTGIGIKKQDLSKLFQSFQQVDSKRNRNVEGTGLGLAITKNLLSLMGGDIEVESEYGKGSTFKFHFPQPIVDETPSVTLKDAQNKLVVSYISNEYIKEQLAKDCEKMGVECVNMSSEAELLEYVSDSSNKERFILLDGEYFTEGWREFASNAKKDKVVLLIDFFDTTKYDVSHLLVMKKPLYLLNLVNLLKGEDVYVLNDDNDDFDFIAPDAKILVVDDNAVNLTIVEGLLRPLNMKISTAISGKEAIERINSEKFDIIFMDHMMPEMDGIETTRIIRRFYSDYNDVPIIALTANAVDGTKEMFLNEGMNDFVSKPIELRMITSKIKQWLPVEKIKRVSERVNISLDDGKGNDIDVSNIGDLDTEKAIMLLGSKELFWSILETYYKSIEKKADLIKEMENKGDWAGYTIEVHSLKSFSSQVGATELSSMAADMERAGNAREIDKIHQFTDIMLEKYRSYLPVLEPYFHEQEESDEGKEEIDAAKAKEFLERMKEAFENLDIDVLEEIVGEMSAFKYEDWQKDLFERLKNAAEEMDFDACESIAGEWEEKLG